MFSSWRFKTFESVHRRMTLMRREAHVRFEELMRERGPNKAQLLHGYSNLLSVYERDLPVSGIYIEFSTSQKRGLLNDFFSAFALKRRLTGKDYCTAGAEFPLPAAFLETSIGCSTNPVITALHTVYFDNENLVLCEPCALTAHDSVLLSARPRIEDFNEKEKRAFGALENINLSPQKVHMREHVVKDVARHGDVSLPYASPFKHFNHAVKRYIQMSSMQKGTGI